MTFGSTSPNEVSYLGWDIQHTFQGTSLREITAANFQDIFNLTKRTGEVEVKMNRIKFRAEGIGGMLGIAGGAFGGPLGSIIGFGVGRALGSFVGSGLANKYYGQEKLAVNENLFLSKQRDSQLKLQQAVHKSLGDMVHTFRENRIKQDQKIIQDMIVL